MFYKALAAWSTYLVETSPPVTEETGREIESLQGLGWLSFLKRWGKLMFKGYSRKDINNAFEIGTRTKRGRLQGVHFIVILLP
jgi:hypothetical protein